MGCVSAVPADDCVFCGIVAGRLPCSQVYADGDVVAFLDIRPVTVGHLLIVPRDHAASIDDIDDETGARLFAVARLLARAVRGSGLPCEGINLFVADGVAAGQEVFHLHVHVIPRSTGDGFGISARWQRPGRPSLDATAAVIRNCLGNPAADQPS